MKVGLRTNSFWDDYVKNPAAFLSIANGRINFITQDAWWTKQLFTNFNPANMTNYIFNKYPASDYVNFFRAVYNAGIKVWLGLAGVGLATSPSDNFFLEYPNSVVGTRWINPDYADPSWGGNMMLEEYAERLDVFAKTIGIPLNYYFEDWQYPDYLITTARAMRFRNRIKALDPNSKVYGPGMGFCSSRPVDYNWFAADHPKVWEYIGNSDGIITDVILQRVWNYSQVYHSAMNVSGWLGPQMCAMSASTDMVFKLYWGGADLNMQDNPNYSIAKNKEKLKEAILAAYLTRIIGPEGEWCPIGQIAICYKPPPTSTIYDLLEVLDYARNMEYLKQVTVKTPVLVVSRTLGQGVGDAHDPLSGYMNYRGLIPTRFVHEDNVGYVKPTDILVTHSCKDYSADMGYTFNAPLNCTWLVPFNRSNRDYAAIFHDGGYESGNVDYKGASLPADKTSYLQPETITLNGLSLGIPPDSVTIVDNAGNLAPENPFTMRLLNLNGPSGLPWNVNNLTLVGNQVVRATDGSLIVVGAPSRVTA
jgi:hypothetical protein